MKHALVFTSILFLSFAACTKKQEASNPATIGLAPVAATPPGVKSSVKGTVAAKGKGTAAEPVRMNADKYCSDFWKGKNPTLTKVSVGSNGGLKGAVVYLKNAPKGEASSSSVTLDQKGCLYDPTVVALQTNQTLVVKNSDSTLHNVHGLPKSNSEFNFGQSSAGATTERKFAKPEVGIRVKCDVHGWMLASVSVFDHPYFAVTDEEGAFEIKNVPDGQYEVEVFHPVLGNKGISAAVAASAPSNIQLGY